MYVPEEVLFSQREYVAPTVYTDTAHFVSTWNYYSSLQQATEKWAYLNGHGGTNYTPAGFISFPNDQKAHTMGFNCDFYILKDGTWQLTSYKYLKSLNPSVLVALPIIYRFIRPDGAGIFYAIFNWLYFGLSATSVKSMDPDKLAELDAFYREVQLMKFRYNALVGFLNALGKKQLNAIEQQTFNEGMLLLSSMNNQIAAISGIELEYSQNGAIGNPIILIIIIIVILSAATAWTISTIAKEREKTKRINDSYELSQWIASKKQEIAQQVGAGTISQANANDINKTLDAAAQTANTVATNAAKDSPGLFGDIASIVKWGVVGIVAVMLLKNFKGNNNAVQK